MSVNPLLEFSGLPRYKSVRPEHVAPAIDQLLVENRALIARLTTKAMVASWNEFADPLENANERLWRAWGMVAHLHAVDDNPAIRDAYNANLPKITRYRTELAQNLRLYEKFKALRASKGFEELSQAQRKIVENDLRDYRLGGAELAPQNKRRFAEIQEELAALEAKFSENLLDATNAFSELIADRGALLGVPEDVLDFLNDLAARALPHARRDHAELEEFARTELGIQELQAWDIAFASEKLRAKRYAFSDQEVKRYFPEPKVLEGMFQLVKALYGIRILPDAAETWHPEVRFFRITDSDGSVIGQFYLDLYSRETKRGGAWMDEAITRQRMPGGLRTPVAHLICNFPAPIGNKPALFTHDEVMTLFHEFGHGLHHLLSRVDDLGVSGIRGVQWDAVELPSQFMENFCWEWGVLARMTAHVESGEALPRSLFDKMLAARNFQSGMQTVRQIEFALSDMHLHHDYDPAGAKTPLQLLNEIRAKVAVAMPPEYNRFLNNFSHVFSGAYAAGYYSYKWAEVLSADAYSLFEENGVLDSDTGARFRDEILAVGGSRPALESFRAFRGREPRIDALLRHNGMIAP